MQQGFNAVLFEEFNESVGFVKSYQTNNRYQRKIVIV